MNRILFIILFVVIFSMTCDSQIYSFLNYQKDNEIANILRKNIRENKIDSLKINVKSYKNRLGFLYYEVKAIIDTNKNNQMKYIDSSFMRGLTPLCLPKYLKKNDSLKIQQSFKANYLKSYNIKLINIVDSLAYRDQYYRQLIYREQNTQKEVNTKRQSKKSEGNSFKVNNEHSIDNLLKLQKLTDSTNFTKLNSIIAKYGWPSANKVGLYYCQRAAPDATLIIIHLASSKRPFQIATLADVIELCKKQEESWQVAESLMSNLHGRYRDDFYEFTFLKVENDHLDIDESFLSIYTMAVILMQHPNDKIEIKCKNIELFKELKKAMVSVNDMKVFSDKLLEDFKRDNFPMPQKLNDDSFLFVESEDLKSGIFLYKYSAK